MGIDRIPILFGAMRESIDWARVWRQNGDSLRSLARDLPWQFRRLVRVRSAGRLVVTHHDNGFFANFVAVLDALAHKSQDAVVRVDWTLRGDEGHFKYGEIGENVWDKLFEPLCSTEAFEGAPGRTEYVRRRINPALVSANRDHLHQAAQFELARARHHDLYRRWVRVKNPKVTGEVDRLWNEKLRGRHCIGVHKRLALPEVNANQAKRRLPSTADVIRATRLVMDRSPGRDCAVYLATDDADAVSLFRTEFGERLVVRESVSRVSTAEKIEVHTRPWVEVTLDDACDVLIDGLLLARCQQVLHLSSNISTAVALMNPDAEMIHVTDVV